MATIEQNKEMWNDSYNWEGHGDEWSREWGSTNLLWLCVLMPRIQSYVPTGTILEIAPGYGRWTGFLSGLCKRLIIVDLSEKCIEYCKRRFAADTHISYHVNDGKSLDMVEDGSVDFAFSFDSLVHVEADVMDAYLTQLARKLTPNGVAFIHHSNIGEYRRHYDFIKKLPRGRHFLARLGLIEETDRWRAFSMTAGRFRELASKAGLECIAQELVNWQTKRLIDCMSLVTRRGSTHARPLRVVRNGGFMDEARRIAQIHQTYCDPRLVTDPHTSE